MGIGTSIHQDRDLVNANWHLAYFRMVEVLLMKFPVSD